MITIGSNMKFCVTCAKYDGQRVSKGYFVEYEQSSRGKCYARFIHGVDMWPACSCAEWVKWAVLR